MVHDLGAIAKLRVRVGGSEWRERLLYLRVIIVYGVLVLHSARPAADVLVLALRHVRTQLFRPVQYSSNYTPASPSRFSDGRASAGAVGRLGINTAGSEAEAAPRQREPRTS